MRNKSKMIKKLASIALALLLAAQPLATLPMNVFAGTGSNGIPTAPTKTKVESFEILGAQKTVNVDDEFTLTAGNFMPADAHEDYKKVEWTFTGIDAGGNNMAADSISVTKADTTATIKVSQPGQVTITATAGDKTASVEITVRPLAESITLNKSVLALSSSATGVHEETLQATVLPEGADQIVSWESNNPAVAEVDGNGLVKAVALGEATITAKTANDLSATCKVYVCEVVVVKSKETPRQSSYVRNDIIVNSVKLTFSEPYVNVNDSDGWYRHFTKGNFTLTVVPADDSNIITIRQCIFYRENTGQSYTSNGPNFSCAAFRKGGYYGITKVDVYFTSNANNG